MQYDSALKLQHEQLMRQFSDLDSTWKDRNREKCRQISTELAQRLGQHHSDEVQSLFKNVSESGLQLGGPFCTYYFEFFMMNRPIKAAEFHIEKLRNEGFSIQIPPELKTYFDKNSHLTIPLEEHLALAALANALAENFSQASEDALSGALHYFGDLLRINIEKEEKCFWCLFKNFSA